MFRCKFAQIQTFLLEPWLKLSVRGLNAFAKWLLDNTKKNMHANHQPIQWICSTHCNITNCISINRSLFSWFNWSNIALPQNTKPHTHTHKHKKNPRQCPSGNVFASIHHVSFLYSLVGGRQEQTWRSCSGTHEIVPDAASFHYALRRLCSILYSGEKCLKPVGQDVEAFSTTRLAFEREHASLPTMTKGRFCMSLEKGSDPGKPMMRLRSIPSLRSLELYNWASDADSLPEASM